MSITFHCPGCEKKLTVKAELAGKRAKCPACGTAITIPASQTATALESRGRAPLPATPPSGKAPTPDGLGRMLCRYPAADVYEGGIVAGGREGRRLLWADVQAVWFHSTIDYVSFVTIPVFGIREKKLTLETHEGKLVLKGDSMELIYPHVIAGTKERMLSQMIQRLRAGETLRFGKWLSLNLETFSFPRSGLALIRRHTVPWTEIASVSVSNGEIYVRGPRREIPLWKVILMPNVDGSAKVFAIPNAEVLLDLCHGLSLAAPGSATARNCPSCSNTVAMNACFCRHCWGRFAPALAGH